MKKRDKFAPGKRRFHEIGNDISIDYAYTDSTGRIDGKILCIVSFLIVQKPTRPVGCYFEYKQETRIPSMPCRCFDAIQVDFLGNEVLMH